MLVPKLGGWRQWDQVARDAREKKAILDRGLRRERKTPQQNCRFGRMERPNMLYDACNIEAIVPEIAAAPQDEDVSFRRQIMDPKEIRHDVFSAQGHHEGVDEYREPQRIRLGSRQVENTDLSAT